MNVREFFMNLCMSHSLKLYRFYQGQAPNVFGITKLNTITWEYSVSCGESIKRSGRQLDLDKWPNPSIPDSMSQEYSDWFTCMSLNYLSLF
jgi:hypothetical protein